MDFGTVNLLLMNFGVLPSPLTPVVNKVKSDKSVLNTPKKFYIVRPLSVRPVVPRRRRRRSLSIRRRRRPSCVRPKY